MKKLKLNRIVISKLTENQKLKIYGGNDTNDVDCHGKSENGGPFCLPKVSEVPEECPNGNNTN